MVVSTRMLAARFSSSDFLTSLSEGLARGVMLTFVSSGRVSASCAARFTGNSTQATGIRGKIPTKRRRIDMVCATASTCPCFGLIQYITGLRRIGATILLAGGGEQTVRPTAHRQSTGKNSNVRMQVDLVTPNKINEIEDGRLLAM